MTGKWPNSEISYINGKPSDTRWANLLNLTPRTEWPPAASRRALRALPRDRHYVVAALHLTRCKAK